MDGFLKKSELTKVRNPYFSCIACGLHKHTMEPKLDPVGLFKKGIMVIGSKPFQNDNNEELWIGDGGDLLNKAFARQGIDLYEDCVSLYAVNCYSGVLPNSVHINCCRREKVQPAIEEYQPKVIILLGDEAIESVILDRWKKKKKGSLINLWRGWAIPDQDYKCWICPTYDPRFVKNRDEKIISTVFRQDLEQAFSKLKQPLPKYKEPNIEYITDLSVLDTIKTDMVAFDYEGTGLKPHAEGHEIICCAVAYGENNAYSFMLPFGEREKMPLVGLLQNQNIQKIAANMKYEDTWTFELLMKKLNVKIKGWAWDTMLGAHILDQRSYVTGLKFQTYVNFGIADYDSDMEDILQAPGSANDFNKLKKFVGTKSGIDTTLKYCGLDAIYEYRLAMKQMKELNWNFLYL